MIETSRLILRPFRPADRMPLVTLLSDQAVMQFSVSGPKPADDVLEDLDDWTRRHVLGRPERWAVTTRPDDRFIGFCGFSDHLINGEPFWELGYRLLPDTWGRGFATEAASACRDWFFAATQIDRFALMIDPANIASARVAEKLGAQYEFDADCYGVPVHVYIARRPHG
ncbi:MAG: GNAT family N-acetyltransferase [Planctomycetaceae bacterium]